MWAIHALIGLVVLPLFVGVVISEHPRPFVGMLIVAGIVFGGAIYVSSRLADAYRHAEIASAIANGLKADCESLFSSFRDHPLLKQEGYIRLFPGSQEFEALPDSIRRFEPVYVTIEERPLGRDFAPNIGLCKNGFGGFHMGLRVFKDAPDIPESQNRKRVGPGIYLWLDET